MTPLSCSLLNLKSLRSVQVRNLFSLAREIKKKAKPSKYLGETIGLLFFEASTRTRMSFETAAYRMGLSPVLLDGGSKSSLEKGESIEDSILNVAAMMPHVLVVRCGDEIDLRKIQEKITCGIINAGWGVQGHPTQALLDLFTMQEFFGFGEKDLEGKRILLAGDVRYSRVAASHLEVSEVLGTEIAVCAPPELSLGSGVVRVFEDFDEGLVWADVVILLRCQFERHQLGRTFSAQDYRKNYGFNSVRAQRLKPQGLIMHPGPILHGLEMETEVLSDLRCRVFQQVTNGVYVRESLLRGALFSVEDLV